MCHYSIYLKIHRIYYCLLLPIQKALKETPSFNVLRFQIYITSGPLIFSALLPVFFLLFKGQRPSSKTAEKVDKYSTRNINLDHLF